jgi:hypothetical protein
VDSTFHVLSRLLGDFTAANIETCCALLDTCGRFLHRTPETHAQVREGEREGEREGAREGGEILGGNQEKEGDLSSNESWSRFMVLWLLTLSISFSHPLPPLLPFPPSPLNTMYSVCTLCVWCVYGV